MFQEGLVFKPKLCCLISPEIVCHCNYSLCSKHLEHLSDHISTRPNTNYYYYCHTDFAVVWHDIDSKPVRYRLAFYENKEGEEDKGSYQEKLGSIKSCHQSCKGQKEVSKNKRKRKVA